MGSDRRLVLHIGMPKTGSTTIQDVLAGHQRRLRGVGVRYGSVGRLGSAHHPVHWAVKGTRPEAVAAAKLEAPSLFRDLRQESELEEPTLVYSSEAIFTDPDATVALFSRVARATGRRLEVLVYLRRQADQAESWYRQAVKGLLVTDTFGDFLDRGFGDYATRLQRIRDAARVDPTVRVYERSRLLGGDSVTDFWGSLGLGVPPRRRPSNASLDPELTELKRRINFGVVDRQLGARLGQSLAEWSAVRRRRRHVREASLFTLDGWSEFQARFDARNESLAADLGLDVPLFADPMPPCAGPPPLDETDAQRLLGAFRRRAPGLGRIAAEAYDHGWLARQS